MEIYRSVGVATIATQIGRGGAHAAVQRQGEYRHIERRCERAVVATYAELTVSGVAHLQAFQACSALYRTHHPEASPDQARHLVETWLDRHILQSEGGPDAA